MSKVKYFYVRNDWKKRDITIASEIFDENGVKFVKFGWAFRCNHDKFIKKEGRQLSLQRMVEQDINYSATIEVEDFKFYDLVTKILDAILTCPTTPKKYREDIMIDLHYFAYCAVNGTPKCSWETK
jgi:hypothetical protein